MRSKPTPNRRQNRRIEGPTLGWVGVRTFDYDSLKRLTSATNPESGTVTYQYDEGGNLRVKTDARGVSSHYEYDGLNRLIRRWYNSDPADTATTNNVPALPSYVGASDQVKYLYDSQSLPPGAPPNFVPAFSQGRSIAVIYGNGTAGDYYSYDEAGRIKTKIQQTGGVNYPISSLVYNLAGSVRSADYPSGRSVSYSYDTAGRTNTFSGDLGDATTNRTYSENISYSPFGGMTQEKLGTATPIYHKSFYNSRGQLAEIRAGLTPNDTSWQRGSIINFYGICWGMCGGSNSTTAMPENNGNLRIQQIQIPNDDNAGYEGRATDFFQFFEYDQLNRLQFSNQVSNQENWRQEYKYDRYGNRTVRTEENLTYGLPDIKGFEIQTGTNRLYSPGDLALPDASRRMRYDDAGNLKHDTYTGQGSRTYDAENRMVTAQGGIDSALQYYSYDGDGRRVKRKVNNVETWQVYGIGGELIAEYAANAPYTTPEKEYGYRNGQLLITATSVSAGWGPPPSYSGPNPLTTGDEMKLENLTELRTAVNSLRAHAGLQAFTFTVDPNPVRYETAVKADHIRQLRTALEQARLALGLSTGGYTHPTLTENESLIYAIDFQELRNQIASAWNSSSTAVDIRWMVTDQLGTPRMIFDQSGSLASTKRHDYLPFGEELFAGTGGRTTAQGYTNNDGARQKFTSKERDNETGLDYFGARYYASTQGRFTSPDPLLSSGRPIYPQSWNRYSYVINHPLSLTDPNGLDWGVANWTDKDGVRHIDYQWFNGDIVDYNGHSYTAVNFGGDASRIIDLSDGRTIRISNDRSNPLQDVTAHPQAEQEPTLAPSWLDKVPIAHESRQFLFHYSTHNFEAALGDFTKLSVELGTLNIGASAATTKAFATEAGEAIFYSGGKAAFQAATEAATTEGGKTISMTFGGRILNKITDSELIWNWASKKFAQGASGEARVFLREPVRMNSTWNTVEYPILRVNPFVRIVPK